MSLQIAWLARAAVERECRLLQDLRSIVQDHRATALASLRAAETPDEDFGDYATDEKHLLQDRVLRLEQVAIVGLYAVIEVTTRRLLTWKLSEEEVERQKLTEWKRLKRFVRQHGGNLENLQGYTQVDTLRLLNNALKHRGTVSKPLADVTAWKYKQHLMECPIERVFEDAVTVAPDFIRDLSVALHIP